MNQDPSTYTMMDSPLGTLLLVKNSLGLTQIRFPDEANRESAEENGWRHDPQAFKEPAAQLKAYFQGDLRRFDLPLAPQGTPFQRSTWQALQQIPYGETISYAELAGNIGRPSAARAVGAANGKNPLPIVIPCHRVIGADGSLTGYGGGLHIKKALLELESSGISFDQAGKANNPGYVQLGFTNLDI